jgi:two-component system LytT family response regulator
MMRIVIVDDEAIALDRLEGALACIPEAELAGRAMSGRQAIALTKEQRPDVVLLDISMPGQDGLTIMRALRELTEPPEVIFVTALDQHAVRAFELHAADYLLKPVAFERLREALRRAGDRLRARTADRRFAELDKVIAALKDERPTHYDQEIWVRTGSGVDRVAVKDVAVFKAEGDYVAVKTKDKNRLIKEPLASLHERLDPAVFLRVHRSTVINVASIKGVRRRRPRGIALVLDGGEAIEVGPSYTDSVMTALNARRWR